MNAKQYNTAKEKLYKRFNAVKTDDSHEVFINTTYGKMYISSEWMPRIKVANIHSRLDGNTLQFKEDTGYPISKTNDKCNFYFTCPENALDELEEYLDNLNYLSK